MRVGGGRIVAVGVLRPIAGETEIRADLALFDPATITDRATVDNPGALAEDVVEVLINGDLVCLKRGME